MGRPKIRSTAETNEECSCSGIEQACDCEKDCWYKDYLVLNGFAESCDCCGKAGSTASDGWIGVVDEQGRCAIFCSELCAGEENMRIFNKEKEKEEAFEFIEWMDEFLPNHGFFVDIPDED